MTPASAVYVHVPFCLRKCPYCDFYSVTAKPQWLQLYRDALLRELELRVPSLASPISSVYFGGGTPSLLPPSSIRAVLRFLEERLGISPDAEITVECNPSAQSSRDSFLALRDAGVNRLSLGVQSFHDVHLQALGRLHTGREALMALRRAVAAGFASVSVDLIFGLPNQKEREWSQDLRLAVEEGATHISTYELTVEEGTRLAQWVEKGVVRLPGEDRKAAFYRFAHDLLTGSGFEHYEISNYALPGHRCRHNLVYWHRLSYAGFGPSAHSFDGEVRTWNVRNVRSYCRHLERGDLPVAGRERLAETQAATEVILLGLRTSEGIDLAKLTEVTGQVELADRVRQLASGLSGYLQVHDGHIRPTLRGFMAADAISAAIVRQVLSALESSS